jgi:hypothetical protein
LKDQDGKVIDTIMREMDVSFTNNIERVFSDINEFYASHLIEGKRRWTLNMRTSKQSNDLLDISRAQPALPAGQLDLQWTMDQAGGWYQDIRMAKVVLASRSADLGQDVSHVEESFAGMAVGPVTVDMRA